MFYFIYYRIKLLFTFATLFKKINHLTPVKYCSKIKYQ